MIRNAGFDGCFWVAEPDTDPMEIAKPARDQGLFMEFIHAPVPGVDKVWIEGEEGESHIRMLTQWMYGCARAQIPMMVCHVWTKYTPVKPGQLGIDRFGKLLDLAQQEGVKIAFENAEVPKFMTVVCNHLGQHPAAGFCFDSGHELCYTDGVDQLAQFGDKLLCTHLNDNMGRTGELCTSADDAHMMPFDGLVDWQSVADRLKMRNYQGTLTFELKMKNKPGKHTHDRYLQMTPEEILQLAFEKACRFEELLSQS